MSATAITAKLTPCPNCSEPVDIDSLDEFECTYEQWKCHACGSWNDRADGAEQTEPVRGLDDQESAIILAGLRMIQRMGIQNEEDDIASGGGEFDPLGDDEIEVLCDRLSRTDGAAPRNALDVLRAIRSDNPEFETGAAVDHADVTARLAKRWPEICAALGAPPAAPSPDWRRIAQELAGALDACTHQIGQMRGMFDDADGTIREAVNAADEAAESYRAAVAGSLPPATIWTVYTDGDNLNQRVTVHATKKHAEQRVRKDLDDQTAENVAEQWEKEADGACIIEEHELPFQISPAVG
ncbi:hypothetical protein OOZ54_12760 [Rhodopseudomonas palustris]|uniref:hypothetical protein n=1 Tax=Rhodopseudomonas palustris TaxID=1076 RepID=UPI0022EFF732|nr:hypothetical protein [Rhodopseudomonas palustris]WBU27565.1 hypothetical protein OOZ54_12760 [Rhodopseudomonas palustris]